MKKGMKAAAVLIFESMKTIDEYQNKKDIN